MGWQKYRQQLKKDEDDQKDMGSSYINARQGGRSFYFGNNESIFSATPTQIHRAQAVQFPHHMNLVLGMNPHISTRCHTQSHIPSPSPSPSPSHAPTQLVPPQMGHSLISNGVSGAISGRNGMLHRHRMSEFASDLGNTEDVSGITCCDREGAEMVMGLMNQNEINDAIEDLVRGRLPEWNLEDMGLSPFSEPLLSPPQDLSLFQANSPSGHPNQYTEQEDDGFDRDAWKIKIR
ncbi:PREDICTED: uncharacterized protein LOC104824997 [Tarenaya hassleriana]|uniref:uncharacterized protein LOC104824997 n=1 Tax=Tarenaya hassleriana TaxID=28532 RepID=UPI00053C9BE3|nr:PREDICTED: uncharacterized protein LOC104824997 [Tarenaya hassleriana]